MEVVLVDDKRWSNCELLRELIDVPETWKDVVVLNTEALCVLELRQQNTGLRIKKALLLSLIQFDLTLKCPGAN